MPIQKSECPAGGKHSWVSVNPGTKQCSKCKRVFKIGGSGLKGTKGDIEISFSTLLLIGAVIAGVVYYVNKGKTTNATASSGTLSAPAPSVASSKQVSQPQTVNSPENGVEKRKRECAVLQPLIDLYANLEAGFAQGMSYEDFSTARRKIEAEILKLGDDSLSTKVPERLRGFHYQASFSLLRVDGAWRDLHRAKEESRVIGLQLFEGSRKDLSEKMSTASADMKKARDRISSYINTGS
jgi:hypothetical protein